jgi:hypothetical protein
LYKEVQEGTINEQEAITKLNNMDEKLTKTMLISETESCKRKDPVLWTPESKKSNPRIQYWNLFLKSERQRICSAKLIGNIKSKMDTDTRKRIEENTKSLSSAFRKKAIFEKKCML